MRRALLAPLSTALVLSSACVADVAADSDLTLSQPALSDLTGDSCLFGATKQALLASPALSVGPSVRYTAASRLSPELAAQLATGIDGITSPAALFAFVQDGELFQQVVTEQSTGRTFTLTTYWAGDTPHGFLHLGASSVRVATIQDDSVMGCWASAQRPLTLAEQCTFGSDAGDFLNADKFTVTASKKLSTKTPLTALGEQQVRALADGAVRRARDVFATVDGAAIERHTMTDRGTGERFMAYVAKRGGGRVATVFRYGTLDVAATIASPDGTAQFTSCLAPAPRVCLPDEAGLLPAAYDAALEEAMQNAYSACRYCTGLEVRAWDVVCPGDAAAAVVNALNDATQGRPGYEAATELSAQAAQATLASSGIDGLVTPFADALNGASDVQWFVARGRYEPTAPGVDGAETLVIATSASARRAVSVTVRDEYP